MCGIAGYLQFNQTPADPAILRKMAETMRSRGPDDEGVYLYQNVGLVHRRLSILDLSGGKQPMCSDDESVILTYNGEIFNYQELKRDLENRGHHFRTHSDTEVLLHLYLEYGERCVEFCNGFFAFAVLDLRKKLLFFGRDRLGVKPFYYFMENGYFAFASSLAALGMLESMPKKISEPALLSFLQYQYVPDPQTIYQNVFKLPPAHVMTLDLTTGVLEKKCYWTVDYSKKQNIDYPDAVRKLQVLLRDSVVRRLVADVPLGVFLSGGVDSTIIAGLASEAATHPLECFSIGFQEQTYDESFQATRNAEHLQLYAKHGINHHVEIVNPCDFSQLRFLIRQYGEPYADASMLPTSLLCAYTRKNVVCALSGDGADEIFGGYDRYLAVKYGRSLRNLPTGVLNAAARICGRKQGERSFAARLGRLLRAAGTSDPYSAMMIHSDSIDLQCVLKNTALLETPFSNSLKQTALDVVEQAMEHDLHHYLPGDILPKVDGCSMASSLEVRSPFLDYRIVEFAASLPREFKQRGHQRKRILCDAFPELLPSGLAAARKRGFGVPLASWFRNQWKEPLREALLDGSLFQKSDLFQKQGVERILRQHLEGQKDLSYLLFSLLILSLFFDETH